MKRAVLGCGAALVIMASAACLQPSFHPLITPEASIFDPALIGEWRCSRHEAWTFAEREEDGRRAYTVRIAESGQTVELLAWLGRIGDATFIDFVPDEGPEILNEFFGRHVVATHTFGRVSLDDDVLRLRMLEMDWTAEHAKDQGPGFGQQGEDDFFLLTAPTNGLRQLAAEYGEDEDAFPVQVALVRAPGDPVRGKCYVEH